VRLTALAQSKRPSKEMITSRSKKINKNANMGEKSMTMPEPPKGERCMILRMGASTGSVKWKM